MEMGRGHLGEEMEMVEEMVPQEVAEKIGMDLEEVKENTWMVLHAEGAVFWEVAHLVEIGDTTVEIEIGDMIIE